MLTVLIFSLHVINNVCDCMRIQYADVWRALSSRGSFTAAPEFSHNSVNYCDWQAAKDDGKEEYKSSRSRPQPRCDTECE